MVKKDTKMSEVKIGEAKKASSEVFDESAKVVHVVSGGEEKCASDSGCCGVKRRFFSLRNIFFFIVVGLFIAQYAQFQTTIGNLSFLQTHDDSLITEVGQLKGILTKIGGDLNQVREYIGMPVTDYDSSEDIIDLSNDESKNTNRLQLALFKYVDYLSKKESTDTILH